MKETLVCIGIVLALVAFTTCSYAVDHVRFVVPVSPCKETKP